MGRKEVKMKADTIINYIFENGDTCVMVSVGDPTITHRAAMQQAMVRGTKILCAHVIDDGVTIDYETQKLLARFVDFDFSHGIPFPIR
jgi:hypothetical protein